MNAKEANLKTKSVIPNDMEYIFSLINKYSSMGTYLIRISSHKINQEQRDYLKKLGYQVFEDTFIQTVTIKWEIII